MIDNKRIRLKAIFVGLLVSFIWATSWIIIPIVLKEIPPISFAGIRFMMAGLILLIFHFLSKKSTPFCTIEKKDWLLIVLTALTQVTFAQITQYFAMTYVDAITLILITNFNAIVIMGLSILILKEKPTWLQVGGVLIFFVGLLSYFYPFADAYGRPIGFIFAGFFILSIAFASIIMRELGRRNKVNVVTLTSLSMLIGAILNLVIGYFMEGVPSISVRGWGIIFYLAVINTALAFSLWNWTFKVLTAIETALISSTMLVEVAILDWIIYGRQFGGFEIVGLIVVAVGVLLVQMRKISFGKEEN